MSTPAAQTTSRKSPFQGLGYYAEADARWFFGRESERKTLISNLRAARLTLLYAESGVGKSSLLRAGVASRLREIARGNAEHGSPKFIPVVFTAWKDDPVVELIAGLEREANSFSPAGLPLNLSRESLSMAIETASQAVDATFLVILDQFEEYFGYRSARNPPERLADELAEAIAEPKARANFLVAIREDSYARLGDLFAGQQINVYGNYLHLEYLSRAAAREAIERPIARFNATHNGHEPVKIEPALTEAVLDAVRRGRLVLGQGAQDGNGGVRSKERSDEIETPFLQVVMTRLWELELGQGSRVLRKATLDELGGAETLVRTHLDGALAALADEELAAATDIFHELVTPSGAKIAHTAGDLATMTARHEETVGLVLEKLDSARVVRSVDPAPGTGEERYEIFHDRLAGPLLDWVGVRDNERLRNEARAERRRANIFKALAIGAAVLFALALLAVVFAEIQKGRADRDRRTAQSLQLAASAESTLAADPELSTLLALHAVRVADTEQAVRALRGALPQLRLLATLHTGSRLNGAAFSPDGSEVVTAGADRSARIWSASTHQMLGVLRAGGRVTSVAFSPDGKRIVTAGVDGIGRIWSTTTHQQLAELREPGIGELYSAAFSPDGKEIVTASPAGTNGHTTQIWSASSHSELGTLSEPNPNSPSGNNVFTAVFSPDGKEIVTASEDGTARIYSAISRRQLGVLREHQNSPLRSAAFSPDGKEIVTASEDGTAGVWSAISHQQLGELAEPGNGELFSAAFSREGTEIVTASEDGTARVWSATDYRELFALAGHTGPVVWAAFSPDGRTIVTASKDGTAKLWNAALEQRTMVKEPDRGRLFGATFSPDGKSLLTASEDGTARIWSAANGHRLGALTEPTNTIDDRYGKGIVSAAFGRDGKQIVTASLDGSARIWSATNHKRLAVLIDPGGPPLLSVAFSADGKKIITAGEDRTTQIWSTSSHQLLGELPTRRAYVSAAGFSRNGKEIVTADEGGNATIWSATSYRQLGVFPEPDSGQLSSAAFSPDGTEIVTASADGTARIWSASSHKQLGALTEPDNSQLSSAAFSPDGKEIVTASVDGTARIWSSKSLALLTVFTGSSAMNYAAFSPDGTEIVTASKDGAAQIWSTELAGPLQAITRIAETRLTRQLTPAERTTYLGAT